MIRPGDVLSLSVERPAAGGRMIARHRGAVVLVGHAIPGERVRARVTRTAKGVAFADAIEIESASPDRRAWRGDAACGGCLYGHIAYARQLAIKAEVIADAFARIARLPLDRGVPIAASPEEGYRMRARLHVRGLRLGFFREATHELCDAAQTRQLTPEALRVLSRVEARIRSLALSDIQEIELAENADGSERAVAVDATAPIAEAAVAQLAAIEGLTGVAAGRASSGTPFVTDTIALGAAEPVRLRRHVLAFFQGNRFLLSPLVAHTVGRIDEGSTVIDLYAGGGLFSVAAARARGARVTSVEGDRIAAADLAANVAAIETVAPRHESVEAFLATASADRRTTLVVDPPRTGLSNEAADGLVALRPVRIVYVSCDVATLARDVRKLVAAGYRLDRLDAFDLFPNTPHVECVGVMERE